MSKTDPSGWRPMELENKPDFEIAMKRIYAWFDQTIIDRAPIQFGYYDGGKNLIPAIKHRSWASFKEKWYDTEYQIDWLLHSLKYRKFYAETFPIFWPNLGPGIFASFYGCDLTFSDSTSWTSPLIKEWEDIEKVKLDMNNVYLKKIEESTLTALEFCKGKFLVGYTDLHCGMDCAADWRDPQQLCMDIIMEPDKVKDMLKIIDEGFIKVFNHFDKILKDHRQLSVCWMGVPSFGKLHIPSCDFSTMISNRHFEEFCLPSIKKEISIVDHNIYHLDGKGAIKHLDYLLDLPEINAIQWMQGEGADKPIMSWIPLIKKIQQAHKSVIVWLSVEELEPFMKEIRPEGILLNIDKAAENIQPEIIKKVERWK